MSGGGKNIEQGTRNFEYRIMKEIQLLHSHLLYTSLRYLIFNILCSLFNIQIRLLFNRTQINNKAILNIIFYHAFISLIDLLDGNNFHIGHDIVCGAVIEHFLAFA